MEEPKSCKIYKFYTETKHSEMCTKWKEKMFGKLNVVKRKVNRFRCAQIRTRYAQKHP